MFPEDCQTATSDAPFPGVAPRCPGCNCGMIRKATGWACPSRVMEPDPQPDVITFISDEPKAKVPEAWPRPGFTACLTPYPDTQL